MQFYENQLFHIYNQGNNKRKIFFTDENHLFFLWKMRAYLPPFGDLVAWTLMPNHFHWLFFVRKTEVLRRDLRKHIDEVEFCRRLQKYGKNAKKVNHSTRTADNNSHITLNDAIGDIQKGYTRAINKERGWTGSLFREKCKAKDGWIDDFVTVERVDSDFRFKPGNDYGYLCLCYIHNNATEAGMVEDNLSYEYSSAKDYAGHRNGTLCNLEMGQTLLDNM